MIKKTDKQKEAVVEEVNAEKVESAAANKPAPKYHFSVKLTPEKLEDAIHEAETPEAEAEPSLKQRPQEEKKIHFPKEEAAVQAAETPAEQNVQHIKYSEDQQRQLVSSDPERALTVEELKTSIVALKNNKKAFRELQNFVKPPLAVVAKKALEKRVSLKYWNNSLIAIMKGVDHFITFVTKPSTTGENEAVQKARTPILFGIWVFFLFFIVGGLWASLAPLDQSTHAHGYVVTASKKQIIQNREGGILEAIYVQEGDHVKVGQALAKLTAAELTPQLKTLYEQKSGAEKRLKILQDQLKAFRELAAQGYVAQVKVLELEQQEIQAKAYASDINAKLETSEEHFGRLTLKSPVDGVVTQINVHTIGGTIGHGQPIMTVTPTSEDMVLEAYVRARDIEPVHVGLKAKVMIAAFHAKTTAHLDGIVTYVSPDVVDFIQAQVNTQEARMLQQGAYYKVRISIDKAQLKKISKEKDYDLVPGMEASVQITVGERTLMQYMLNPIIGSFWGALKEK